MSDRAARHRAAQSRYRKSRKGRAAQRRWREARAYKMFRARLTAARKARSAAVLSASLARTPARAIPDHREADW